MNTNPNIRPDFFGKDSFTPFIGVVEDVNDPKQSGRVKVRCVGWHPKSKAGSEGADGEGDFLSTEDLPWARVGMPVTHAQQSRIGGKHGLLPGTWVMGFFLDGDEGNDPFVISTFNFTSKASEEDLRSLPEGEDGTFSDSDKPFDKVEVSPKTQPNIATRGTDEQGERGYKSGTDPSGDNINHEADGPNGESQPRKSAAYERRANQPFKEGDTGNAEAQQYDINIGDGRCGYTKHARTDINKVLTERMPSQLSRFSFNDAMWNRYTGSYLDLNGIMKQVSVEIGNFMKQPANAKKGKSEEKENRPRKSKAIVEKPDRDGKTRIELDAKDTEEADIEHALFQEEMIDTMISTIFDMLQQLNNGGGSEGGSGGGNSGGGGGSDTDTPVLDWGAICITDQIIANVEIIVDEKIKDTKERSQTEKEKKINKNLIKMILGILGNVTGAMEFVGQDNYAMFTDVFNRASNRSQDEINKENSGCHTERAYNTVKGALPSMGGAAGGGAGGGGGGGGGAGGNSESNTGFAGYPISSGVPSVIDTVPCEGSGLVTVPGNGNTNPGGGDGGDGGAGGGGGVGAPGRPGGGDNDDFDPDRGESDFDPDRDPFPGIGTPGGDRGPQFDPDLPPFQGIGTGGGGGGFDPDPTPPYSGVGTPIPDNNGDLVPWTGARDPRTTFVPGGRFAQLQALSLPSGVRRAAENFNKGVPNVIVVVRPGRDYYFNNSLEPDAAFPTVFIPGYDGTPTPVIEPKSGEFVAVLSNFEAWDPQRPGPPVSAIPDSQVTGISSRSSEYNIVLGGFFVRNIGNGYSNPTIQIIDKDTGLENGTANAIMKEGRIVDIEITNPGKGYVRIPQIIIKDQTGFGAKVYPIMQVLPNVDAAKTEEVLEFVYCPAKNQVNFK